MNNGQNCITKLVDGQELVFCPSIKWLEVVNEQKMDDTHISDFTAKRLSSLEIPLHIKYLEFQLAGFIMRYGDKSRFTYYALIQFDDKLQRVDVRGARCEKCDWRGFIGNPDVPDIYVGVPNDLNAFELMKKADIYPQVLCPACRNSFEQRAIWVGEL